MRKFAFAMGMAALMLLAGVFTAEAMTGSATLGLRSLPKIIRQSTLHSAQKKPRLRRGLEY